MQKGQIIELDGPHRFRILDDNPMAKGGCAEVWRAERLPDLKPFAIKIVNKYSPDNLFRNKDEKFTKMLRQSAREIAFLKCIDDALDHHIMPLVDSGEIDGAPAYVMPLADFSLMESFRDEDAKFPKARLTLDNFLRWTRQILFALKKIHETKDPDGNAYVHRDVKPDNILIMGDDAYLSDFGGVKNVNDYGTKSYLATPRFAAPELLIPKKFVKDRKTGELEPRYLYKPSADMYSLGVLLYSWLMRELPACQTTLCSNVPSSGKPGRKMKKYWGKIGGLSQIEKQKLKASFIRLAIPELEDKTDIGEDIVIPLPAPQSLGDALVYLVDGLLKKKPEERWSARDVFSRLNFVEFLLNPKIHKISLKGPLNIDRGKTYKFSVYVQGTGLVARSSWMEIALNERKLHLKCVKCVGKGCWHVHLKKSSLAVTNTVSVSFLTKEKKYEETLQFSVNEKRKNATNKRFEFDRIQRRRIGRIVRKLIVLPYEATKTTASGVRSKIISVLLAVLLFTVLGVLSLACLLLIAFMLPVPLLYAISEIFYRFPTRSHWLEPSYLRGIFMWMIFFCIYFECLHFPLAANVIFYYFECSPDIEMTTAYECLRETVLQLMGHHPIWSKYTTLIFGFFLFSSITGFCACLAPDLFILYLFDVPCEILNPIIARSLFWVGMVRFFANFTYIFNAPE